MNIFEALGIDEDSFSWPQLAQCKGMSTDLFFDKYESSPRVAEAIDDLCFSCVVQPICLKTGVENGESGVWGGVFLVNGRMDESKNSHKTKERWNEIRELIANGNTLY